MVQPDTIVLSNGGMRSFVAATLATREFGPRQTVILHQLGNDPAADTRLARVRRQADYLDMSHVITVSTPEPKATRRGRGGESDHTVALSCSRLLLTALAEAIDLGAARLIWPVQVNEDFELAARITEQTILARHLAELEHKTVPSIESPLLDLADHQVVELGNQMDLPWELAWSCLSEHETACRACAACRRRHAAFEAAHADDPIDHLQLQH